MKKVLIASLLLGLGTQVAHASKARLIALGQDKDGSLFLDDSRNVFKNASYVNNVGNMAFIDFGSTGQAGQVNVDVDANQKAEGGAFFKYNAMTYGVYLGNENDTGVLLKSLAGTGGVTMPQSDNVLELSVAGKAALDWGVTLGWAPTKDEQGASPKENKSLYTRLGIAKNQWEAYVNVSIQGESDDRINDKKYDGGGAYDLGGSYEFGENTVFARYKTVDWDQIDAGTKTKGDYMEYKVGLGHTQEVSSSSRVIYELRYDAAEANVKFAGTPAMGKITEVPFLVGFEADANSWLTLRGSISQTLFGSTEGKNVSATNFGAGVVPFLRAKFKLPAQDNYKGSIKNSTNVNAGATLKFGNLSVDGLVGTGGNGTATSTTAETGSLSLDRLMTRVSATYMF